MKVTCMHLFASPVVCAAGHDCLNGAGPAARPDSHRLSPPLLLGCVELADSLKENEARGLMLVVVLGAANVTKLLIPCEF